MNIKYCDRCGMQLESYIMHITYAGNNEAELCEECANRFEAFLDNDSIEDRIRHLTESRDWWRDQCKEFYEDYKVVTDKLSRIYNSLDTLVADKLAKMEGDTDGISNKS